MLNSAPLPLQKIRKQRKKMEKKIYSKPEVEIVEISLEESLMQFGNTSIAFKPEESTGNEEYY